MVGTGSELVVVEGKEGEEMKHIISYLGISCWLRGRHNFVKYTDCKICQVCSKVVVKMDKENKNIQTSLSELK